MYRVEAAYTENGVTRTEVIHGSKLDLTARITRGTLKEFVNAVPTFSFVVYPNNPGYDTMHNKLTKVTVTDTDVEEDIFIGLVGSVGDVMSDDGILYKNIICKGELDYLNDVIITRFTATSGSFLQAAISSVLTQYNLKASTSKKIQNYSSAGTIGLPAAYEANYKSAAAIVKELCEMCGYEYKITYENGVRYLEVSPKFGEDSSTEIALSVNLQSMQRTVEASNIITRYYPLGAVNPNSSVGARLGITGTGYLQNAELEAKYGVCEMAVIYDDIEPSDWESSAAVSNAQDRLRAVGQKDYNKIVGTLTSFSIKAVDLSFIDGKYAPLKVYNTYRVINKLQNIDEKVRLTGRTLNIDDPYNPTLTFGEKQTTLTAMIAKR